MCSSTGVVTIREARRDDAPGIARVHVDSWRTTYRGVLPDAFLAGLSYADRERLWERWLEAAASGASSVFVAEELSDGASEAATAGDLHPPTRIVGFASGGPAGRETPEYSGELNMIYLLQSHQRRGLGRALLRRVVERLALEGRHSLFVWVARDNPSRGFYEALGGTLVRERRATLFGVEIDWVGSGWDDTGPLLRRLSIDRSGQLVGD